MDQNRTSCAIFRDTLASNDATLLLSLGRHRGAQRARCATAARI